MNARTFAAAAAIAAATAAGAGAPAPGAAAPAQESANPPVRLFGDFRSRQEMWDHIPLPLAETPIARGGYNNSFRFRTRIGAECALGENATFNVRLAHMAYDVTAGAKAYEWPDELVIDNAYLELRDISGDGSRLVFGRQDIVMGSGRLVFDATPLDASRTIAFDGVFFRQPLADGFSADAFAIYDRDEDNFAIGHEHRSLRGYSPAVDGHDEAAAALFLNGTFLDGSLPGSFYYIWKHETSARAADGTGIPNADIHTLGLLLRPKFSDTLSGELEYAREFDPNDNDGIDASLAFASLKYAPKGASLSPWAAANFEWMSGDDPDTRRNEAFNPLFSRMPLLSELVIYCYDTEGAGNWNNLLYPHLTAGISVESGHSLTASAGRMFAEERNGAGGGRCRGDLYAAQWGFPLFAGFGNGRGKTAGHLRIELFDPGDYYVSDRTAYYLRWEILVSF